MPRDREVAGIRCMQVLDHLSAYLDGELDAATVDKIEEHLRGCNWCEQFGREFTNDIERLRSRLAPPEPVDAGVSERLMKRVLDPSAQSAGLPERK